MAAAAAGLDAHAVARAEPEALLLFNRPFRTITASEREASRPPFASALCAPGWKARAVEIGLQRARLQHAVGFAEAQAAAKFSRARRILPQRKLLKAHRKIRLLQLKRNDARVAMRHGAEGPCAIVRRTGAPAAVAAVVARKKTAVGATAVEVHARVRAEMAARHAFGQRLLERLDDGIDHGRKRRRIIAHGCGRVGA